MDNFMKNISQLNRNNMRVNISAASLDRALGRYFRTDIIKDVLE